MGKRYSDAQEHIIRQVGIRRLNELALHPTDAALREIRGATRAAVQNQEEESPLVSPVLNDFFQPTTPPKTGHQSAAEEEPPYGSFRILQDGQDGDSGSSSAGGERQGRQGLVTSRLHEPDDNEDEEPYIAPSY